MTVSPLAFAWVSAHLKRRGLSCNYEVKPVDQFQHQTNTVQSESVTNDITSSCSSSYGNNNNNNNNNNSNVTSGGGRDSLPPRDAILAVLGHRLLSGETARLVSSQEVDDVMSGRERSDSSDKHTSSSNPQRNSPRRVASGVLKFVEQQTERVGVVNGSVHVCFVLHTVLTACVRHALRYGRITASSTTAASNVNTVDRRRDEVLSSPHIDFTWSRTLAAEHLVEVARDAAVQKRLRSLLWKMVDKEHRRILQSAITLCREESDVMSRFGLHESDVRQLFGIPKEIVTAAYVWLRASTSVQAGDNQQQQLLSLMSERHFSFISSSPQFAAFLKEGAAAVKERHYQLLQKGKGNKKGEANTGGLTSEDTLKHQWVHLIMDMARVRMAIGLLLQFEILARRCVTVGNEQKRKEEEKQNQEQQQQQPQQHEDVLIVAQELCSLAIAAGSRALETSQHLKRFMMFFRVSTQSMDDMAKGEQGTHTPYCTLKSVFSAISPTVPNVEKELIHKKKGNKNIHIEPDSLPSSSSSSVPARREAVTAPPRANGVMVEDDPLMRAIMSARPPREDNDHSLKTHIDTSSATHKKGKKSEKALPHHVGAQQSPITWHFRCCTSPTGASFNPATAAPCGVGEKKVELLRPSRYVPWPFTLEAIVKNKKNESKENHSDDSEDKTNTNSKNGRGGSFVSLDNLPDKFTYPATSLTVWMHYNSTWMTSASCLANTSLTSLDQQHTAQLQRLLKSSGGRLVLMNGCPAEKIQSLMRIVRREIRLVVRFR